MTKMSKKDRNKKRRKAAEKRDDKIVPNMESVTGILNVATGGFGFVIPEKGGDDIFIPPKRISGAMTGDKVEVALTSDPFGKEKGRGPVGKILKILRRDRNSIVGELISGHKISPLNRKLVNDIAITGSLCGAKRGDWVEVTLKAHSKDFIVERRQKDNLQEGVVATVIGKAGTIKGDLQAIIKEYKLPLPYTDIQNNDADKLESEKIKRVDLTKLFTLTIDPLDAKDFDDAISYKQGENENEVEIGIHIADVAAWIQPGSKWDKLAKDRAFTSYLPGMTLPMLPKALTRKISLTADEIVPAHSLILIIDKITGKINKVKERCHSNIFVNKRLTYSEVQYAIDGKKPSDWTKEFLSSVMDLVELTRVMRAYRKKSEKFLELDTAEIHVMFDDELDEIIGVKAKTQRESEKLVEECMLAANSEIAKELIEKNTPGLYRTHEEPAPEKLEEFAAFMASTFGRSPGDLTSRVACNHFLKSLKDDEAKQVILSKFLQSLPRATYLEKVEMHYGLGKGRYSHFTSPIRRYADLLVHQQLWTKEFGGKVRTTPTIAKFATDIANKEKNNDEAYFAANDRMKLHYLQKLIDTKEIDIMEGSVTKIMSRGLLVDLKGLALYGFVPIETLKGDFRVQDGRLVATQSHKAYKLGDKMSLLLNKIDFIKGSAIFSPFEEKEK